MSSTVSVEAGAPPADEARVDPGRPWFPALDGLRGLAAVLVVVFHVTGAVARFPDWTWGAGLARFGNLGVALFFVLSGFLLSRPFFADHLAGERPPALGRYAVRRLARIVPAYWVALTVWLFVIRDGPAPDGRAYALFYGFAQVYDRRYVEGGGSLSVAWTLSIEMSFYIVLPALAWVLCRLASRGSIGRRVATLAASCTALFVGGAVLRWWMWEQQGTDWPLRTYTVLGHIGWFGIGMALAALAAGAAAGVRPPRWVRDLAGLPVLSFGLAAAVAWLTTLPGLPPERFPHPPDVQLLIFVCNGLAGALCLLPLVIGDQTRGTVRRALSSRPARWLGEISYGLYLWHTPILTEVNQWVAEDRVPGSTAARFAIVAVLSLAAAHVSWVVVERPVLALANKIARR